MAYVTSQMSAGFIAKEIEIMKNTRLGITNSILATVMFLSGTLHPMIMFGLIVYTLLCEEDVFSRLSAKRAITIYVFFTALSAIVKVFDYAIRLLAANWDGYNTAFNKISYFLNLVQLLVYLFMAIKACMVQDTQPGVLDGTMNNVMQAMSGRGVSGANGDPKPLMRYCSNCGSEVAENVCFCKKCGAKID